MRVLVTGSAGFIGRHFAARLHELGYSVLGVDIGHERHIDARDFFRTSRFHFDLVIHAAAVIPHIANRLVNPMLVRQNIEIDAALFTWAMATRPSHVVYFSSAAAYPLALNNRIALHEDDINLDDIRQPDAMYGFVKLVGEVQALEAQRQGLDVLVVRPQSGYGADQGFDYPFPGIISRARRSTRPLTIWGSGDQVRDFVHVDDVVDATMALLESEERRPVNIGTGIPTTLRGLAEAVAHALGDDDPVILADHTKPEGSPGRWADVERLHKVYVPAITLEEGIKRALSR